MNDKARHIRERYTDKKHVIESLMSKDPEFHDLCEDHDACVDALRYWSASKAAEAETRVNEYRTLIQELLNEIAQVLERPKQQRLD